MRPARGVLTLSLRSGDGLYGPYHDGNRRRELVACVRRGGPSGYKKPPKYGSVEAPFLLGRIVVKGVRFDRTNPEFDSCPRALFFIFPIFFCFVFFYSSLTYRRSSLITSPV